MAPFRTPRSKLLTNTLTALSILLSAGVVHAAPGPGIGNIDCGDAEYFKPFKFIDHNYPGDPHGQNVTVMIRGYFMTVYAPDSGAAPGRIGIYDVSDPKNPIEKKYYSGADPNTFREQHSLPIGIIDGKYYIAIQTRAGIQFWNFTDPLNATVDGRINLPGVNGGDYENVAWQASWQGHYLYVTGGNQGIYVIDASDPTNPQLKKQVSTAATGGFRVGPLFAMGDLMVVSNMDQGGNYSILDIADPVDPALLDHLGNAPRMYSIAAGPHQRFYTAGRDGNFLIHSFEDPTNIKEIKNAMIGQDQLYTAVQDHFVYLGRQENVVKVDVTNEQNPQVVGEGTLGRDHPDHGQVTPLGNLIYIGNDHGSGSAFFCHQRGKDTIPLSPDTIYPADGSVAVSSEARVTIVFSDFVDLETLSTDTVTIRPAGGEPLTGLYSYQFNHLSFSPDQPFEANTTYEISIATDGLKDVMGNGLEEDFVSYFSTGTMITIPDPAGTGGAAGTGGSGGGDPLGTGGANGGVGGSSFGVGGTSFGVGGTTFGVGGTTFGVGGTTFGVGGTTFGVGGAGTGGALAGVGGTGTGADGTGAPPSEQASGCATTRPGGSSGGLVALGALGALAFLASRKRRWS